MNEPFADAEMCIRDRSRSGTFEEDTNDPVKIAGSLEMLAESVHRALLRHSFLFKTVTLKAVSYTHLDVYKRQVPIQSSGIFSQGSSVTGTATYKITDADINTGSVTNLASAIGSFNNQPVISPQNIETVHYKQPTSDRANNNGFDNGGYGDAVVPVVPIPMMYSSPTSNPMYGSVPGGYGNEPYGYTNGPYRTTETPNSESNGHKAKAYLSKHKHHTIKHHKTGKKIIQNLSLIHI